MTHALRCLWGVFVFAWLGSGLSPLWRSPAYGQDSAGSLATVLPLLDEQTIGLIRIDVAKADVRAISELLLPILTEAGVPTSELQGAMEQFQTWKQSWVDKGGGELFVALNLADIPQPPGVFYVPMRDKADPKAIVPLLQNLRFEEIDTSGRVLIAGSKAALARLKQNRPAKHEDLQAAFQAVDGSVVQIAVQIPADVRRVASELSPKLPPESGVARSEELVNAFRWLAIGAKATPQFQLRVVLQASDAMGAQRWQQAIRVALKLVAQQPQLKDAAPNLAALAEKFVPEVKESRLELDLSGVEGNKLLRETLAKPLASARSAAARSQSMNNLRQIALAMHNYHDTFRKFPAAASRNADGKPLLSWRVHILPFVEQYALYQKFRLDEPWDSEHNRQFIPLIPKTYVVPSLERLAAEGKTVYVVPVGEKAVFASKEGTPISKITDGTSNTIMAVQVPAEMAVVWTKPADWEYDVRKIADKLFVEGAEGILASFCDGSVRVINKSIAAKNLLRLVQMDDGELVDPF